MSSSGVQFFRYTVIQVFRCQVIRVFGCTGVIVVPDWTDGPSESLVMLPAPHPTLEELDGLDGPGVNAVAEEELEGGDEVAEH